MSEHELRDIFHFLFLSLLSLIYANYCFLCYSIDLDVHRWNGAVWTEQTSNSPIPTNAIAGAVALYQ